MDSLPRKRDQQRPDAGPIERSSFKDERSLWMTGYRLIWGADLSAKLKHVLHVVFFRCGVRSKCFAAVGTLSRLAGADASTVRRHLHELVENGLLNAKPVDGQTTCYTIRWSQLKQLQRLDADVDDKQEPSEDLDGNPFTDCDPSPVRLHDPDSQVASPPLANCQPNKLLNHNLEQTPSTGRGWAEINKELRDAEVKWPDNAVKSAREKHCSLQDIQAVIDFGYSHRDAWDDFGLALYHRVANATPDQRPDDPATWMKMKSAFINRTKEVERREKEDDHKRREAEQRQAEREQHAAELQRLEDQFGVACDRLTAADVRDMATQDRTLAGSLRLLRGDTSSRSLRPSLLRQLAARSPPSSAAQTRTDAPLP